MNLSKNPENPAAPYPIASTWNCDGCRDLSKLIWAIALKCGGEIRLDIAKDHHGRDDWKLIKYTDFETGEIVIKADFVKAPEPCVTP